MFPKTAMTVPPIPQALLENDVATPPFSNMMCLVPPAHTESEWPCEWSDQLNMVAMTGGHFGCNLRFCLLEASFHARRMATQRTSCVGSLKPEILWSGTEAKAHRCPRCVLLMTKKKSCLKVYPPDPDAQLMPCGPQRTHPAEPFLNS